MAGHFVSRGFIGRRRQPESAGRLPPGQYITPDFPVLSAGPTPAVALNQWTLSMGGLVREPVQWTWDEFLKLPAQTYTVDIHCVTKWTKLDTVWTGVSLDTLLERWSWTATPPSSWPTATADTPPTCRCREIVNGQAFVAYEYDGLAAWRRNTVARRGWSCPTSTSGRAPSGSGIWS